MGNVHLTIPSELAGRLVRAAGINGAVETGTFHAEGARSLRGLVPRVWTIELSETFYDQAVQKYGSVHGINFLQGESAAVLRRLRNDLPEGPVLFWLDAHGGTDLYDIDESVPQCPVLGEIEAIRHYASAGSSCILIDDARFFLGPVTGHLMSRRAADWPTLTDVIDALRADGERYITILDDVIICVPPNLRAVVDGWWLDVSKERQGHEAFEHLFHQAINPTVAVATKRLVKSLVPERLKHQWYQRSRRVRR